MDSLTASIGVIVKALVTNINAVYVGGSGVTVNNGHPLQPGQSIHLLITNSNLVYCITDIASPVQYVSVAVV